jgi:outer membrane protein TolC
MKSLSLFLLAFVIALAGNAQTNSMTEAGGGAARAMSLEDCIQQALAHNYDVQIQRYNPQLARYVLEAAYDGYDPVFNISGQHNFDMAPSSYNPYSIRATPNAKYDENSFTGGLNGLLPWGLQYKFSGTIAQTYGNQDEVPFTASQGSIGVALTQPLLKNFWIDATRLNIRVAKSRLQSSEQGLRVQIISAVTAVANAYYELAFAQQNVRVLEAALDMDRTQLDQDKKRAQVGALGTLSVQQDESQVAQAQAGLIAGQSVLATNRNVLKNLLTDNYVQWHDVTIQPATGLEAPPRVFNLQDSWSEGMAERPDLSQALQVVKQQGIEVKYYRNQLFPELDLIGSYGFNGASVKSDTGGQFNNTLDQIGAGQNQYYSYGAQLTVPLSRVGPRNQFNAARASLQQTLLQLKQLQQNILVEIDNAVIEAQSTYQSVQATRQARVYVEAALDAEQKTYAVGKASTFEVLQYQNTLTAARSQEIRALADYNEALANLAQQEGATLEQYNIHLEAEPGETGGPQSNALLPPVLSRASPGSAQTGEAQRDNVHPEAEPVETAGPQRKSLFLPVPPDAPPQNP